MTISEYAEKHDKKIETVLKWIYEGLIPRASVDNDYIPNSARKPYRSNARKAESIYKSIVNACLKSEHISAKTFGLCEDEFEAYIDQLTKAKLITKRITDDVMYYDASISASEFKRKEFIDIIAAISYGTSLGVSTAIMNSQ